jgi:molybdopterin synthase catalytic subunit
MTVGSPSNDGLIKTMDRQKIVVTDKKLDLTLLNQTVQNNQGESGASVIFTGCVRVSEDELGLTGMTLEHFPGMTESLLGNIVDKAMIRWQLNRALVVHRIGHLTAGEPIVFVGTCALHRKAAFEAAEFIMDYLKNEATFWKKEHYLKDGQETDVWVESKISDAATLDRWR